MKTVKIILKMRKFFFVHLVENSIIISHRRLLGLAEKVLFCLSISSSLHFHVIWKDIPKNARRDLLALCEKKVFLAWRSSLSFTFKLAWSQEVCNLIRLPNNGEMNFIFPRVRSHSPSWKAAEKKFDRFSLMRFIEEWGNVDKLQQETYENVSRIPFPI